MASLSVSVMQPDELSGSDPSALICPLRRPSPESGSVVVPLLHFTRVTVSRDFGKIQHLLGNEFWLLACGRGSAVSIL